MQNSIFIYAVLLTESQQISYVRGVNEAHQFKQIEEK